MNETGSAARGPNPWLVVEEVFGRWRTTTSTLTRSRHAIVISGREMDALRSSLSEVARHDRQVLPDSFGTGDSGPTKGPAVANCRGDQEPSHHNPRCVCATRDQGGWGGFLIIYDGNPERVGRGAAPGDAKGEGEENTMARHILFGRSHALYKHRTCMRPRLYMDTGMEIDQELVVNHN